MHLSITNHVSHPFRVAFYFHGWFLEVPLRQDIHDKRLIDLIKKYLKSGVMENGVRHKTEEGSPQGGNLSPLLANIYLDKFDKELEGRGVRVIRYADDIVLLAKRKRASARLLETSTRYLEKKLKLKVNAEKSRAVSVDSIRNFKFLGSAMGRNRKGAYIRVHPKSRKKAKEKLKRLTSRSQGIKQELWSGFGNLKKESPICSHIGLSVGNRNGNTKSRVKREFHARFRESLAVKSHLTTRLRGRLLN